MLQPGVLANITNSTIRSCSATSGSAICTDMADEAEEGGNSTEFDRRSILYLDVELKDNKGDDIVAGPYFELMFTNPARLDRHSKDVVWRRRLCDRGEYVLPKSGYCEQCPASMYSLKVAEGSARGHDLGNCTIAPVNGNASGGAVLVPLTENWHNFPSWVVDVNMQYSGCSDCHVPGTWARDLQDIKRCAACFSPGNPVASGLRDSCHVLPTQ